MVNNNIEVLYSNSSKLKSIINLKILLFLDINHNGTYFQNIQKVIKKSKSQLSVSLGKLEKKGLIVKTETRPQTIVITKEGHSLVRDVLKEINHIQISLNKKSEKIISDLANIDTILEEFMEKYQDILKKELTSITHLNLNYDDIKRIAQNVSDEIHDLLYEMVKSIR